MDISTIPSVPGARKRKKRLGCGIGSGRGKTCTRGQKGQRARSGSSKRPGFEGGRNPLIRTLPKRGFKYKARGKPLPPDIINVSQLQARFEDGDRVTLDRLQALGLISSRHRRVKLLGDGKLAKRLTVTVHHVSQSARTKLTKAGGSIELVAGRQASRQPQHAA